MADDNPENVPRQRLNNNEFLELMPLLKLEELFTIEIRTDSWKDLFKAFFVQNHIQQIKCYACNENITCANFKSHINTLEHKEGLTKVKQFYHPYYTYAKSSYKLTLGEAVSIAELKNDIKKAETALEKTSYEIFENAKIVAKIITAVGKKMLSPDSEKKLNDWALNYHADNPTEMFAETSILLDELPKLEFSVKEGVWSQMLTTDRLQPNSKFFCAICQKSCAGIITVNAHINGNTHKLLQLKTLGVRISTHPELSKYCSYRFDKTFSITVRPEGRDYFKKNVLEPEPNAENDTKFDIKKVDTSSDQEDDGTSDTVHFSKLSESVAAKVKALVLASKKEVEAVNIDDEGLIGVEYVVEISKEGSADMYECCLCEAVLGATEMQLHLICYRHRLKYCEMHYPDTIRKYKDLIGHQKYHNFLYIMANILSKVALAIEQFHGRSIPYPVPAETFKQQRAKIVAELYSLQHACQNHGPSFSNVVKRSEIFKLKLKKSVCIPPIVPDNYFAKFKNTPSKEYLGLRHHKVYFGLRHPASRFAELDETFKRSRSPTSRSERDRSRHRSKRGRSRSRSRSRSRLRSRLRSRSRSQSRSRHYKKTDTQKISHKRSRNEDDSKPLDIWKVFRQEVSIAAAKIESAYVKYRKNAESHPLYDSEWNSFWRRRKQELIAQNIDHRSYNFQPEWVLFFRQRLEQLFSEELENSKIKARKRLSIPLDAEEDSYPAPKEPTKHEFMRMSNSPNANTKTYLVGDQPLNKFHYNMEKMEWKNGESSNSQSTPPWRQQQPTTIVDDKANVIHVLRLMTALEDYLGSFGSKVMELLSKALVLEKSCLNNPKELEQRVLTASNCTLLETAMEKLKGILYAGLLDSSKVQGFNRVIQSTTDLLKHADKCGFRDITMEHTEKSMNSNDLQKLLEVMQNKRVEKPSPNQKSLSDTLMELIKSTSSPKEFTYTPESSSTNDTTLKTGRLNSSFFFGSNADNAYKQENYPYSNPPRETVKAKNNNNNNDNMHQMNMSSYNTYSTRNVPALKAPGVSQESFESNERNNFNNSNINNNFGNPFANNNLASTINNEQRRMFGNNNSSFAPVLQNVTRPSNYNQTFGQADNANWGRFGNNQWSSK